MASYLYRQQENKKTNKYYAQTININLLVPSSFVMFLLKILGNI